MSGPDRITWRDGDCTLFTCPKCGQAARADLHRDRVVVQCFAACPPGETLAAIDGGRLVAEVKHASSRGDERPGREPSPGHRFLAPAGRRALCEPPWLLDSCAIRSAVALTHPDRHPPERAEQATRTTQALTVALARVREIEAVRW